MKLQLASLCLLLLASSLLADSFVYVSLDGENRIAVYSLDDNGGLTKRHDVQTESPPGALCVSPDGNYLYASLRKAGNISSFLITKQTGALAPINTVTAGDDPAFVSTDQTGKYLFAAYYVAAKVTVHRLQNGHISEAPIQSLPTDEKAHAILTDRQNQLAFVPHTGPNAIYQFHFDAEAGQLRANEQPIVQTGYNTGPRQLAFHPTLDVVYFDYEQGSAIAAYNLNRETGSLTFRERMSSLPANYTDKNSNARIEMTPNGRFIYVANRGHNSLAGFAIDAESGRLTSLGQFATEPIPRGFAIDPTSRFLVAAGQGSDKLATFSIAPESGRLARLETYEVGTRPWWVLIADFE